MTPKLTRPFVIQPTANGIALFPLDMVKSGTLDLAQMQVFTELEERYEYVTDPDKLLGFIRRLVEIGEPDHRAEMVRLNSVELGSHNDKKSEIPLDSES